MNPEKVIAFINGWLTGKLLESQQRGFVVGVSGGIDSAVVSTICAMTGKNILLLNMPSDGTDNVLAESHMKSLKEKYGLIITVRIVDLTMATMAIGATLRDIHTDLVRANMISRLRMLTLYAYASFNKILVVGTGNKVEDFGVGFFTKYGDGGVDLSPIADLTKTEVYDLGEYLEINPEILHSIPTDGLWKDGRSDEDAIGASYPELEWAMERLNEDNRYKAGKFTKREIEILEIYSKLHHDNKHKMTPIPVCKISDKIKKG